MLTENQWKLYLQKYEKLIWQISHRISGDPMTAHLEDNYADLCIAALNSVIGYEKKTGIKFDEAIKTKEFDQYTKSVLWKFKAKKGQALTDRMPFRNKHRTIFNHLDNGYGSVVAMNDDEHGVVDIEDRKSMHSMSITDINDYMPIMDNNMRRIAVAIMNYPEVLYDDGRCNAKAISRVVNLSYNTVKTTLDKMKKVLK